MKKEEMNTILSTVKVLKEDYKWLVELNDDELSYQVKTRNDVQNALVELFGFIEDVENLLSTVKGW